MVNYVSTPDDLALFQHQLTRCTDLFRDFRDKRVIWDALAKRRLPVQLQPELSRYADVDSQSPDLEHAITQHVNILMLNGTKIDCTSLDQSDKARGDVDDIRIWLSSWWRKLNDNRRMDKANGRSIVKYGVAVNRLFWEPPGLEDDEDDEDDTFQLEHVNPLECSWLPLKDPEIFFQESTVKWVEARNLRNSDGQYLTLDQLQHLQFTGEREPIAQWNSFASRIPYVRVITRASKDLETGEWTLSEYVYPQSGDGTSQVNYEGGQKLSECTCPLNRCPYFIIPGAGEDQFEQDPHLRYRPMMYRLYTYIQTYNYWSTVLSAMARKYSGDNVVYLDLSSIPPAALPILDQVFPTEGSGATRRLTFTPSDPGSGELSVSPAKIERWPVEIEAHALEMFNEIKRLIADAMPNRFMTGEAFGEVRDGTGTAVINMTEAARIPYSAELTMMDAGIKNVLQSLPEFVIYLDKDSKQQHDYPAPVVGIEPPERSEPGTRITVNATKLARPYNVTVITKNLTQAEESQEALMAYQDYAQHVITFEQLLERRGHDDAIKQLEDLEKDRQRSQDQPFTDQILRQSRAVLFTALSGLNIASLMGLNLPQPPQDQNQPSGQPFEQSPNRNAGGPPVWKPGAQASEMPPAQMGQSTGAMTRAGRPGPQPQSVTGRPAITPAPISGPGGGSSGMSNGR